MYICVCVYQCMCMQDRTYMYMHIGGLSKPFNVTSEVSRLTFIFY